MSGEDILRCYNRGCGKDYSEKENSEDVCIHHPGTPVFHDALKGWSCCQRRVTDFTEFLNIKGCTKSKHSNIKPPEPDIKPAPKQTNVCTIQSTHRKPQTKKPEPRPSDDLPYKRLKFSVTASLKSALQNHRQSLTLKKEDDSENNVIQKGTSCKNNACNSVYNDESSNKEKCLYHPGSPVFHEGYKFWSCCLRRTSDFDEFLKQEAKEESSRLQAEMRSIEVCARDQGQDYFAVKIEQTRFDHYQMGASVVVSVYAKLCDPEKSFVEANQTCIKAELIFGNAAKFHLNLRLCGVIDPEKSSVTYSATKVEIKLRKRDAFNWPSLELSVPPK